MKTHKIVLLTVLVFLVSPISLDAQDPGYISTEFMVKGVCSQCKTRIENAAYSKGVKSCEWNIETGVLKVVHDPQKTDLQKIHASIAAAGHTTDKVAADPEAYNNLPRCCRYDDGVEKH